MDDQKKLDVFNNAMAMANTCSVPIGYIFTRGQGIKCESLIFKECMDKCDLIVGHNLHFDVTVLKAECLRNQIPFELTKPTYCTMKSTTKLCGLGKYPRLGFLHEFLFHEEAENLHSSMIDVLVCIRCYMKLMHSVDICEKVKKLRRF